VSVNHTKKPGTLALVGSGEYTPAMEDTDRYLLETVGGPATAKVVIMATASGLEEPGSPARWTQLGLDHFAKLGAKAESVGILQREDANDPHWLTLLEGADFYYFSGGNPQHLIETMQDTPAWNTIRRGWENGAVLAGCSAGAMAMGGHTASIRAVMSGSGPGWAKALGLLPRVITIPHFDRMAGYIGADMFQKFITGVPAGSKLVGVDENTALVQTGSFGAEGVMRWQVMGQQTVSLFDEAGQRSVYKSGDYVPLQEL